MNTGVGEARAGLGWALVVVVWQLLSSTNLVSCMIMPHAVTACHDVHDDHA